ncbi:MAG TPA: hypothetical protein VFY38_05685 [Pseudonocardia sp.]|nr:hypothetical protein [Pseudonocardia sp.]
MHECPGGCGTEIPDEMLACRPHWYQLPQDVRDAVWRTKHLGLTDTRRRNALAAAVAVYGDAAPPVWQTLLDV